MTKTFVLIIEYRDGLQIHFPCNFTASKRKPTCPKIANRKQILDNYGKIAVGQYKLVQDMPWFWKVDVYSSMK